MSATGKEREMIQAELVRRLRGSLSLDRLFRGPDLIHPGAVSTSLSPDIPANQRW